MEDYDFDRHEGRRPLFIKGCALIIAAIVFVGLGALFMLGTLSVMYKISPGRLLSGKAGLTEKQEITAESGEKQETEVSQPQEKLDLPGLEEKIGGKEFLLEEIDNSISRIVEEVNPMVVNIQGSGHREKIY